MNRFEWLHLEGNALQCHPPEALITHESAIRVYDGDDQTEYDDGTLTLTSHNLYWFRASRTANLKLALATVSHISFQDGLLMFSSPKIIVHLTARDPNALPGPQTASAKSYVKFSFRASAKSRVLLFMEDLNKQLAKQSWKIYPLNTPLADTSAASGTTPSASYTPTSTERTGSPRTLRTGTGLHGVQQRTQHMLAESRDQITGAFTGDLQALQSKASELVQLAKKYSEKAASAEEGGSEFQDIMMSIGIDDPVTRDKFKSGTKFHKELALEIAGVLPSILKQTRMVALTDLFLYLNRARGTLLISPADVVSACKQLDPQLHGYRFRKLGNGVLLVEVAQDNMEAYVTKTKVLLESNDFLTPAHLAQLHNTSVVVAKELLMHMEGGGMLCRDESIQGLRFYTNRFLSN